jgi:hypothetical protein
VPRAKYITHWEAGRASVTATPRFIEEEEMLRINTLIIAAAVGCVPLAAIAAPTTLAPATIKSVFGTGLPFAATTTTGTGYTMMLKVDGSAARTPKGGTKPITGAWHVNTTGYCSKWGKNTESCYLIKQDGTKYSVVDSAGKVAAVWVPPAPAKPAAK